VDAVARNLVLEWLGALPVSEKQVTVSWSAEDAIFLPWQRFSEHWDVFWYPSSDDVTVVPDTEAWVLSCAHFGQYCWRSRTG
jgi:hypothetical protein